MVTVGELNRDRIASPQPTFHFFSFKSLVYEQLPVVFWAYWRNLPLLGGGANSVSFFFLRVGLCQYASPQVPCNFSIVRRFIPPAFSSDLSPGLFLTILFDHSPSLSHFQVLSAALIPSRQFINQSSKCIPSRLWSFL